MIGRTALDWLKAGPPPAGTDDDGGKIIDAEPEEVTPGGGAVGATLEITDEVVESKAEA